MRGMLAVVLGLAIATPASASFMNGNDLMKVCSSDDRLDKGQCLGYIKGVVDVAPRKDTCVPAEATVGQIRDIFLKSMKENPEDRDLLASALLAVALHEAFCGR
jgi:hypothetical protein